MSGTAFESVVVSRSRRFRVLVDDDLKQAAGVEVGDDVLVSVEPREPGGTRSR